MQAGGRKKKERDMATVWTDILSEFFIVNNLWMKFYSKQYLWIKFGSNLSVVRAK